jgi:hypothetical protein
MNRAFARRLKVGAASLIGLSALACSSVPGGTTPSRSVLASKPPVGPTGRRATHRFAPGVLSRVAAFVLLAGCSSISPTVSPAPLTSPSPTAAAVTPTDTAIPDSVRACNAGDVALGRISWQGATATMAGGFELVGTGSEPCTVAGRPAVELLDASGKPLAIQVQELPGISLPVVLLPNLGTPRPDDGPVAGRADVLLYWTNWCGVDLTGHGTLRASIPGVGVLQGAFDQLSTPRCDAPGAPSVMSIGPIVAQDPDA